MERKVGASLSSSAAAASSTLPVTGAAAAAAAAAAASDERVRRPAGEDKVLDELRHPVVATAATAACTTTALWELLKHDCREGGSCVTTTTTNAVRWTRRVWVVAAALTRAMARARCCEQARNMRCESGRGRVADFSGAPRVAGGGGSRCGGGVGGGGRGGVQVPRVQAADNDAKVGGRLPHLQAPRRLAVGRVLQLAKLRF